MAREQVEAYCFMMTQHREPEILLVLHTEGGYKTCEALPLSEAEHLADELHDKVKLLKDRGSG